MFVEEKAKGEVPVQEMKLSHAIREGSKIFPEGKKFDHCALGTGYRYKTGKILSVGLPYLEAFQVFPDVPQHVLHRVSMAHFEGVMTREQCADYLESLGY